MTLSPHHLPIFTTRGIPAEAAQDAADAGFFVSYTEDQAAAGERIEHFGVPRDGAGLIIRYPDIEMPPHSNDFRPTMRFRADAPKPDDKGKVAKYRSAVGAPARLYFPPDRVGAVARSCPDFPISTWYTGHPSLFDPTVTLVASEGEFKSFAASLALPEYAVVGLAGVEMGRTVLGLLPELQVLASYTEGRHSCRRKIIICFDSDAATNPNVVAAEQKLAEDLAARGALVYIARLPVPTDEEVAANPSLAGKPGKPPKFGMDDLLVTRGVEALRAALSEAVVWDESGEVGIARLKVREAVAKTKTKVDVAALFVPEIVGSLALIKNSSHAEFIRIREEARGAGVRVTELEQAVRKASPKITKSPVLSIVKGGSVADGEDTDGETKGRRRATLQSALEDDRVPPLRIPEGYVVTRDGIYKQVQFGEEMKRIDVTGRPAWISSTFTHAKQANGQTAAKYVEAQWYAYGVKHTIERRIMTQREVSDARAMIAQSNIGLPVTSSTAKGMVDWLDALMRENPELIPNRIHSDHFGWQHGGRFLYGDKCLMPDGRVADPTNPDDPEAITFQAEGGPDSGEAALVNGMQPSGTIEQWAEMVAPLGEFPTVAFSILASMASPWLDVIGQDCIVVSVSGTTSRGKTSTLKLAASAWGQPVKERDYSIIADFGDTNCALERRLAVMKHLPVIMDESQKGKTAQDNMRSLIHLISDGRGKGRGAVVGTRQNTSWRLVTIASGETALRELGNSGGSEVRVIELNGNPFGADAPEKHAMVVRLNGLAAERYGTAGALAMSNTMKNGGAEKVREFVRGIRGKLEDILTAKFPTTPERARVATAISAVWAITLVAVDPTLRSVGVRWDLARIFTQIGRIAMSDLNDVDKTLSLAQKLMSFCDTHAAKFSTETKQYTGHAYYGFRSRKHLGGSRFDQPIVALTSGALDDFFKSENRWEQRNTITGRWKALGIVWKSQGNNEPHITTKIRCPGSDQGLNTRHVVIDVEKIEELVQKADEEARIDLEDLGELGTMDVVG